MGCFRSGSALVMATSALQCASADRSEMLKGVGED